MFPYSDILPVLTVDDVAAALDFYARAFGAEELFRHMDGDRVGHAEFRIGDSRLALGDESPLHAALAPKARGGTTVALTLFVDDVDAAFYRAVAEGASVRLPLAEEPWGQRAGWLGDPFGHVWYLSSRPAGE